MYAYYIPIGIGIVAAIVSSIIEGKQDAKKQNPEHSLSAAIRLIVSFFYSIAFYLTGFYSSYAVLPLTGLYLAWYWLSMDLSYNLHKGNHWNYIGRTSEIDKFMREHHLQGWLVPIVKIAAIGFFAFLSKWFIIM